MVNLWTDLTVGPAAPGTIHVVVECLKGDRNKYEYEKDLPGVVLDRVLHSNVHYPSDYGFIPRTWYDDDDPLDALVLVEDSTFPGCVLEARPVGLLHMEDDGEPDEKVIAVPTEDPRFDHVRTIEDVSNQLRDEIAHFFETYKALQQDAETQTAGFDGREAALDIIEYSTDLYETTFD